MNVLRQGFSGLDFNFASGGTCSPSATYNVGDTCTVSYIFSPLHPGLQQGAVSLTIRTTALATTYISGIGESPQLNYLPPQQLTIDGYVSGGANAIAVDGSGDVFVSEFFGPNPGANAGEIVEIPKGCTNSSCVVDYIDQSQLVALSNSDKDASPEAIALDGGENLYIGFEVPPQAGFDTALFEFPRGCVTASCAVPVGSDMYSVYAIAMGSSGNLYTASRSAGKFLRLARFQAFTRLHL